MTSLTRDNWGSLPDGDRQKFIEHFGLNADGSEPELDPELVEWFVAANDGRFAAIKHPLVFSVPHIEGTMHGILNEQLRYKTAALEEADATKHWDRSVFLHERPYRLAAFIERSMEMDDDTYWSLLHDIWIDSENIWQNVEDWRSLLGNTHRKGREKNLMDDEERAALSAMPATFPVYRGVQTSRGMGSGMSWTIDKDRATFFANRYKQAGHVGAVYTATIRKSSVIAYLTGRNEDEIIVLQPPSIEGTWTP